jgi:murein DD-endopeptidase MepM/ murein hydrolase activator NlpD
VISSTRGGQLHSVKIRHAGGVETHLTHLHSVIVGKGAHVTRGQRVGTIGKGDSAEPYVHVTIVVHGDSVDPGTYLPGL